MSWGWEGAVKIVKVALAQMNCPKGEWETNLRRHAEWMVRGREMGCEMIVFPEASLSGYCDFTRFPEAIQGLNSPYLERFASLSAQHGTVVSAGFLETNPVGPPFITQVVARDGQIIAVYRKNHIPEEEAHMYSPGTGVQVFDLSFAGGAVRCGLAVCADSDRPDLFVEMARLGAQVVFHSSAPGLYGRRTDEASRWDGYEWYRGYLAERLPVYSRDYDLYIAVATQTGSTVDEDFPGGSFLFGPDGSLLASTENYDEQLMVVDIPTGP